VLFLDLPMADTWWPIIRRARFRKSIFAPDRGYIHRLPLERWGYAQALGIL